MKYIPSEDFGVLFPIFYIGTDIFISESGFEKCKPTKPMEFKPIEDYVLHLCMEGEGFMQLNNGVQHRIKQGDIFVIPANTANTYYPLATNPWIYRWVAIKGNLVKELLVDCGFTPENYIMEGIGDDYIASILTNIYEALSSQRVLKAMSCVYELFDILTLKNDAVYKKRLRPGEEYFQQLLLYIQKNYQRKVKINELANALSIDRTYVYKVFKKFARVSPQVYILNYRLEKATHLLRRSTLSITDICFVVGFQSTSYFTRKFASVYAMTPRAYRKQFITSKED